MSERGMATVDERTNTLLVQDTAAKLAEIRKLIAQLDIPVRQVLIESRIVLANNDFARELGVQFGVAKQTSYDNGHQVVVGGTQGNGFTVTGPQTGFDPGDGTEGLLVDLPAIGAVSSIGLAIGKLGSHLLQLELSALESEGKGEVISSPRVLTSNQKAAFIETGTEIPYQEASSSGATATSFKKAVLRLEVTPQITPDDRIIMDLLINKDSVGNITVNNVPTIDTNEVSSQVLVDNGETLVLGGIYEETNTHSVTRAPFFGELPVVDWLFKRTVNQHDKQELLIFVTPKIVKEDFRI
jgi:type IV pilus assembly protein PilQ